MMNREDLFWKKQWKLKLGWFLLSFKNGFSFYLGNLVLICLFILKSNAFIYCELQKQLISPSLYRPSIQFSLIHLSTYLSTYLSIYHQSMGTLTSSPKGSVGGAPLSWTLPSNRWDVGGRFEKRGRTPPIHDRGSPEPDRKQPRKAARGGAC